VTWKVYKKEIANKVGWGFYIRETWRFYWLRFLLQLYWIKLRVMNVLGVKASEEECEDFEIDFK
jgi:hypothetical protein